MSDFVQTMRDWRRMCEAYSTDDDDCCEGCPVVDYREHGCGAIFEMDGVYWEKYERAIDKWAAEHPEPVYPTWLEWFDTLDEPIDVDEPIPEEIARKLGLEPKEG